jgi:uncharacterized protein YceH (UPF0502 family)
MHPTLDAAQVRVLGALMEKEMATPEYYPLSLNALVNACNQKSNREPVVSYDEATVEDALAELRAKGMALRISGESRVVKYGQRFTETFNLGRREAALMCVLLLRGAQTTGELRGRTQRLYDFEDLEGVETTLGKLAEMGFAKRLPRTAGSRESRWAHLMAGDVESYEDPIEAIHEAHPSDPRLSDRVAALEDQLASLRRKLDDFLSRFD